MSDLPSPPAGILVTRGPRATITKATKAVAASITDAQTVATTPYTFPDDAGKCISYITDHALLITKAKATIRATLERLEGALAGYQQSLVGLSDSQMADEERAHDFYWDLAEDHKSSANNLLDHLEHRSLELQAQQALWDGDQSRRESPSPSPMAMTQLITRAPSPSPQNSSSALHLKPVPLPTFRGDVAAFDHFLATFESRVNRTSLSDDDKYYYLCESLEGEAKRLIYGFTPGGQSYQPAVELLKNRYGQKITLLDTLVGQLQSTAAASDQISDQRRLFDKLQVITCQLAAKGESLDTRSTITQIRSKFNVEIQRASLRDERKHSHWSFNDLMESLDRIIEEEETITRNTKSSNPTTAPRMQQNPRQPRAPTKEGQAQKITFRTSTTASNGSRTKAKCIFCPGDHRSAECHVVASQYDREKHFMNQMMCLNCTSKQHGVAECPSTGRCFYCKKKHHSSLCRNLKQTTNAGGTSQSLRKQLTSQETSPQRSRNGSPRIITHSPGKGDITAATGTAINVITGQTDRIHMFLDTCASRSLLSNEFAKKLNLRSERKEVLQLQPFGAASPSPTECDVVTLRIQDAFGTSHDMKVYTTNGLHSCLRKTPISGEDAHYIQSNQFRLDESQTSPDPFVPDLILGSEYVWHFLNTSRQTEDLPSGRQLIPTRFGYVISGTPKPQETTKTITEITPVMTITEPEKTKAPEQSRTTFEEDRHTWEKTLALDNVGALDNGTPSSKQIAALNAQIVSNFTTTVEKRDDEYYVQFPWKEDICADLPTNFSIALHRLRSVLRTYKSQPKVLDQYDGVFQDQLNQGIIMEVGPEERRSPKGILHYLAHQAVLTPQKETTKLRIVFDASAHFKEKHSLNDVMHQGPTLLPDLVGFLLRFRIHDIVIVGDVEKAFLQVRLQESEQDATRFLWIHDHSRPVTEDNLRVFRYTRVPFGINASPFLLAQTIRHHLLSSPDQDLAQSLVDNTYVDNVIYTAKTESEATKFYQDAKRTFADINMNLREFLSNSDNINRSLKDEDKAKSSNQKILGMERDAQTDELRLKIRITESDKLTKRFIAQQVAKIFDPTSLLAPLTLKAKLFIRSLWSSQYDWDTPLKDDDATKWTSVLESMNNFEKSLPRCANEPNAEYSLVTCTDASGDAIAACVYLCSKHHSRLLMAKSKLTPNKSKPTMPKLELSAITLGMRITQFVQEQIESKLVIKDIIILSDSQIALAWIKNKKSSKDDGIYVNNRRAEIRRLTEELEHKGISVQFGYINTHVNPADCATRGLEKDELQHHFWWTGPIYATRDKTQWSPTTELFHLPKDPSVVLIPESAEFCVTVNTVDFGEDVFPISRWSTIRKSERIMAYILRFIKNTVQALPSQTRDRIHAELKIPKSATPSRTLQTAELKAANVAIIRLHQAHMNLKTKPIKNLVVFNDHDGLIRCRGDLENHKPAQIGNTLSSFKETPT
ncbi:hypothetical protein QR680_019408 [Steinernema hermaphroditum]|uniref:Peptidase aspartic putative domain-containing protein n=1 Tax=Steinernema hermaphroditum TaxID=289476 RepID=A0AA39GMR3_9BILA|nr:hypothetical protein QR680_019408 [Steinernema hermaphroditum]